jgi:hypothetical protein
MSQQQIAIHSTTLNLNQTLIHGFYVTFLRAQKSYQKRADLKVLSYAMPFF